MIINLLSIIFVIVLDLVTKAEITSLLENKGSSIVLFENFISLQQVRNEGATFGIFANNKFVLIVIPIILCLGLLIFLTLSYIKEIKKEKFSYKFLYKTNPLYIGITFIIGGGIGNLYDRIKFSYVRDFIRYDFIEAITKKPFGVGNMADLLLVFGVFIIIIYLFIMLYQDYKKSKSGKIK